MRTSVQAWALLGCGLAALALSLFFAPSAEGWTMGGIAALCLMALFWTFQRQERALRKVREAFGSLREETMTRRSTMRFIFDELLDDSGNLRTKVVQTRHRLQTSLHVASGFLELLSSELETLDQAPAGRYLSEARRSVMHAVDLSEELGRKRLVGDQSLGGAEGGSTNNSTVWVRNRL